MFLEQCHIFLQGRGFVLNVNQAFNQAWVLVTQHLDLYKQSCLQRIVVTQNCVLINRLCMFFLLVDKDDFFGVNFSVLELSNLKRLLLPDLVLLDCRSLALGDDLRQKQFDCEVLIRTFSDCWLLVRRKSLRQHTLVMEHERFLPRTSQINMAGGRRRMDLLRLFRNLQHFFIK